jgi:hypothetical protein
MIIMTAIWMPHKSHAPRLHARALNRAACMLSGRVWLPLLTPPLLLRRAGFISAEMPEPVPRRLLDSASLRLYQATKMAQSVGDYGYGYGYGYYAPPPSRGNYGGGAAIELPDLTTPTPTAATPTATPIAVAAEVIDPDEDLFGAPRRRHPLWHPLLGAACRLRVQNPPRRTLQMPPCPHAAPQRHLAAPRRR